MAYSRVPFTYTGGPQVFPTNFALGVLEADHIRVTVDGVVDGLGDPVEYAFTYNAATGDVTVLDDLVEDQTGVIQRSVPLDELVADFEAGDDVSKRNLVRATKQTLMAVQEAADGREADSILLQETVQDFNDLVDSIADDVALVEAAVVSTAASASAAAGSATTATTQAGIATTQAGLADTARIAAEAAVSSTGLPSIAGGALRFLRVNAAATAYELRTAVNVLADIGAQAANALLTAIAELATNGIIVRTGSGAAVSRSISGTAGAVSVTNGDGVAGNPTVSLVYASNSEAETGTDTTKVLNAAATKAAIAFQVPFTKQYVSTPQTMVAGGLLTLPHGLGAAPKLFRFCLECITAQSGYSIGDVVEINPGMNNLASLNAGLSVTSDATNILVRAGSYGAIVTLTKNTGVASDLAYANWRLVVRAWA